MCPALMFAASRKDRVIGRTTIDEVSISTRNGFNQSGAPSGSKWAIVAFGDFVALDRISISHIGNPNLRVKIRCLVTLNVYGKSPMMFNSMIIKKIDIIMWIFGFILNI